MADNFVSKFILNSQDNSVDVEVKDKNARTLIAQEVTNRSELISKDSDGNTTVNATNGELNLNSKNPIKYSTPIKTIDSMFDGLEFKDNNNNTRSFLIATDHMELPKKQIVVIGDSFSSTAQSKGPLWYTYIAKKYNADVITYASDGMGFIVGGDNNFNNQVNKCAASADINKVSTVYIYGGLNDLNLFINDDSGISTNFFEAVNNVVSNAKSKFPYSEIILVGINTFQKYNYYGTGAYGHNDAMSTMRLWFNYAALNQHVKCIDITNDTLYTPDFYGDANSGGQKHPTATGEAYIAHLIMGGSPYKFDTREQQSIYGTNCTLSQVGISNKSGSIWIHGIMTPTNTSPCYIQTRDYTPIDGSYVLFVNEDSQKASYGVVDTENENIALYSHDTISYYFQYKLS